MSYIERALSSFIRQKILGGFKKLRSKNILPFTILAFSMMALSTIIEILFFTNNLVLNDVVSFILKLQYFIALFLFGFGLFAGHITKLWKFYISAIGLLIMTLFLFIYLDYNGLLSIILTGSMGSTPFNAVLFANLNLKLDIFYEILNIIFFLGWTLISVISLFFMTLYFFTSFSRKILMLGKPEDHIFFGGILKFGAVIMVPMYLYMVLKGNLGSLLIGVIGVLSAFLLLIQLRKAKKQYKMPGIMNFSTAIGFFSLYLIYHLITSFSSSSNSLLAFIIDLVLLIINMLYIIQAFTRRISNIENAKNPWDNPIAFHSKINFTPKLKKIFKENGLIIMLIAIIVGYHASYLSAFLNPDIPIINYFTYGPNDLGIVSMSGVYHRIYLLVGNILVLFSIIIFNKSKSFQEFMEDKYNIKQVFKYIGGFFMRTGKEEISPIEHGLNELGAQIKKGLGIIGEKIQSKLEESQRAQRPQISEKEGEKADLTNENENENKKDSD
ncbi:MAG: hypothetical protein ACTSU2_08655 [Promethearchaeota archaeon]